MKSWFALFIAVTFLLLSGCDSDFDTSKIPIASITDTENSETLC